MGRKMKKNDSAEIRTYLQAQQRDCQSLLLFIKTVSNHFIYQLEIKEALYIKWLDSILNKQNKTLKIWLCVQVGIYFFTIILFHFPSHLEVILWLDLGLIDHHCNFIYLHLVGTQLVCFVRISCVIVTVFFKENQY